MGRRTKQNDKALAAATPDGVARSSGAAAPAAGRWRRELGCGLLLAIATVASYAKVFSNGFVNLDDDYYVSRNVWTQMGLCRPAIRWAFTTFDFGNWHPLTWLSLQLDNQLFGPGPTGYHATNLVLHLANTFALYWLLRQLTAASGRSAVVAAFFALHPLHVESVAWIAERKDVLSALFFLLSLIFWVRYVRQPSVTRYGLALLSFALSLMAKAMGVSLPLLLLLLDIWPLGRWSGEAAGKPAGERLAAALAIEKLPFALLSACIAAITVLAQQSAGAMIYGHALSLSDRLLAVPLHYLRYLEHTVWPVRLAVLYPHPGTPSLWAPAAAGLFLIVVTAGCLGLRKTRPYLIIGWAWFLLMLLPVIGVIQVGCQAIADRYMYLPMIGLLMAVVWGGYELACLRRWLAGVIGIACACSLAACVWLTFEQVAVWRDSLTLWQHALAITPPSALACNNYGLALEQAGDLEKAEPWYRQALAMDPMNYYANSNLGTLLSKKGEQEEAAVCLSRALKSQPANPLLLENMGVVQELLGNADAAIEYYAASARLDPRSPRIHQHLRRVLERHGGQGPPR